MYEKYGITDPLKWAENHNRNSAIGRHFLGKWTEKNCHDAWNYQEILYERKPDYVIECGSFKGGSAFYLATMMDLIGHGKIISIDHKEFGQSKIKHPRIEFIIGSTTNQDIVNRIKKQVEGKKVMVILDSEHTVSHVDRELEMYHGMVTPEQYLIVEDTLTTFSYVKGNPHESVQKFIASHPNFEINKHWNRDYLTSNPDGYLWRKS